MAKGQGLPINIVVLGIIGIVVLVIVVAFTVGSSGTTFGKIGKIGAAAGGDELAIIRQDCNQQCGFARNIVAGAGDTSQWRSTTYCQKTMNLDLDGDGSIEPVNSAGQREQNLKCWNAPISAGCKIQIQTLSGSLVTVEAQAGSSSTACGV